MEKYRKETVEKIRKIENPSEPINFIVTKKIIMFL